MKKLLGLALLTTLAVGSAGALNVVPGVLAQGGFLQKDREVAVRSFVGGFAVGLLNFDVNRVHFKGCIIANTADQLAYDWHNGFFATGKDAVVNGQAEVKLGMVRTVAARVVGTAAGNYCGIEARKYAPVVWAKAKKLIKRFSDKYCAEVPAPKEVNAN